MARRLVKHTDKYPVLTEFEFFDSHTDDCRCVFLSQRDVTIIRKALWPFFTWPTRFGSWVNERYFRVADKADLALLLDHLEELDYKLEGKQMADCLSALGTKLDELTAAISSISVSQVVNCGGGTTGGVTVGSSAGAGSSQAGASDVQDTGEGDPPEGWTSWEEYHAHKCSWAYRILTDLAADFQSMSYIDTVGVAILSLIPIIVTTLATPVPGDEIVVICGLLIGLATLAGSVNTSLSDAVITNFADWVCLIYNATSADQARADVLAAFDTYWDAVITDPIPNYMGRALFGGMLTFDSINRAFDPTPGIELPTQDCSECAGEPLEIILGSYGSLVSHEGDTWVFASESFEGTELCRFNLNRSANALITVVVSEPVSWPGELKAIRAYDDTVTTPVYNSDDNPTGPVCSFYWEIADNEADAYQVTVTLGEECEI